MKLTINEIAELAGVAKSTVSKALNGRSGVCDEKRKAILSIAERVKYQPSASAKALASCRTDTIGMVLPHEAGFSLSGQYWSAMITAVARETRRRGSSLLLLSPGADNDLSVPIESALKRRSVDGFIVGAENLTMKAVSLLVLEDMPFVLLGRSSRIRHYAVDVDNRDGALRIVNHLLQNGYGKIGCIAGPLEYPYTLDRVEGFRSALRNAGILRQPVESTPYITAETHDAVRRLLGNNPDLDALFITAGGEFALDVLDCLRTSGIDLKAFRLAVFDDFRFFDYFPEHISAVRQPLAELGEAAAALLFDLLEGKMPRETVRILQTELICR